MSGARAAWRSHDLSGRGYIGMRLGMKGGGDHISTIGLANVSWFLGPRAVL